MYVTQKHMNNESALSDIGFKNRVVDILSRFDQFDSKIWKHGGRVITVNFRTAQYEGAEDLGKLITRTFNDQLKGYHAELIGTGSVDGKWFADVKFRKLGETMKENLNESLGDSALKSAQKLVDDIGNGGVAAVHCSNKLFGDGFKLTCLGWAIRGVDPVNLCSWEEVNHVGDGKPNELGFVQDFSYKYKINAIHYYGYPQKLEETQFFVDDLGPLKTKLREYKREIMKEKMTVSEAMEIIKESGKKAINESYLERENVEDLYALALESLFLADQVHLWHWTCKSGFHHTHLQEVYESLRDFADELVEVCLASGKKFQVKSNMRSISADGNFDVQDAIDDLEEFIDQIQATAEKFEGETEITTIMDDEAKDLTKELGLLKSFT